MSEKLKRCPFCGGKANIDMTYSDDRSDDFRIECSKCPATMEVLFEEDVPKLIKQWNKRIIR